MIKRPFKLILRKYFSRIDLKLSRWVKVFSCPATLNHHSSLGLKSPTHRYDFFKSGDLWLEEKRKTDGAEDLWRVHNDLYDLTNFIKKHPGGQFWLEVTKGTDITEAFESHHISVRLEEILKNYFVRKAKTPRSSPYTFKDDGFYRTLKRNVRHVLKNVSRDNKRSNLTIDCLLAGTFILAVLANAFWNYLFALVSGICFGFTLVAAHNYAHQRDNFRMYYSDVCMMQSREWRILHVLSHHLYTNTVLDAQAYFSEPFVLFYPQKKHGFYDMVLGFIHLFCYGLICSMLSQWILYRRTQQFGFPDFLPLTLPTSMYVFGGQTLFFTFIMWLLIETIGSFTFSFLGYTTGHFHPDIFSDGDMPRAEIDRDWGVIQLDCVSDRREILGNKFLVLVCFGDHALHHLFPTLDQDTLEHLYPVIYKTMKQFNVEVWMTTHPNMFVGYFRQLAREKCNPHPPGSVRRNQEGS